MAGTEKNGFKGRALSIGAALSLVLSACETADKTREARKIRPILEDSLPHWSRVANSPEQLLHNALHRLAVRDTLGLLQMMPDPDLKRDLYRETPEGRNATEIQVNFAQKFYYLDNGKLLLRSLGREGGKELELVSWKSSSPPVPMTGGGRILRDMEIMVREKPGSPVRRLYFVQSIYQGPKGCKIWGIQDQNGRYGPES